MVVMVTGAAGFIGRAVVRALLDAGVCVRAGLRQSALPASLSEHRRVTTVTAPFDGAGALEGVDAVVHTAFLHRPNFLATDMRAMLELAAQRGIERIVYLSSIEVYGAREGAIVEADLPVPPIGLYGRQKSVTENMLAQWVEGVRGRSGVALRAGAVYGPESYFWIDKMLKRIRLGAWADFGERGDGFAPLVHVEDVARAAAMAALAHKRGWLPLNIEGGEGLTWNQYFAILAQHAGALPLQRIDPASLALRVALAYPAKAWRKLGGPGLEAASLAPTWGELRTFGRRGWYPTDAARDLIGWQPRRRIEDAIRDVIAASGRQD